MQNQMPPAAGLPPGGPLVAAQAGGMVSGIPSYALATAGQHTGETKALLALLFGITGIVGALFMALIGLALGITGLVMGTMSRSGSKKGLSTIGTAVSCVAVLVSLGVWTYAIEHNSQTNQTASNNSASGPTASASSLSTPCYSIGLVNKFNVSNAANSCDMTAYNGSTLDNSTEVYKVLASDSPSLNAQNFNDTLKPAIEKDVKDNLPGFVISNEQATQFAGSPAYAVNAVNSSDGVAFIEEAVLHSVKAGDNVFVLVHGAEGSTTDVKTMEAQWQWK